MSIASEIARLQQAKADLKAAINSKGGNITTEKIDQFASEVASLPGPKQEETKTLTPDFSSGDQVITPASGKVLSQVTLTKPADLLPENIAKDKNICGVVGTSFTAIELTQTQYNGLTPDENTYYLINDGTPGSGSSGGVELIIDETSYGSSITLSIGDLSEAAGKEFFLQLEFGSGPDNIYCLTLDRTALSFILAKATYGTTTTVHPLRAIPDVIAGPISYNETVTVTVVNINPETWAATVKFDIDIESYENDIRAKLYSWNVE